MTVELWELPVPAEVTVVGETLKVQEALPGWITVTVWPATVSVPVRPGEPGFAAIEKATEPLPVPLAPCDGQPRIVARRRPAAARGRRHRDRVARRRRG